MNIPAMNTHARWLAACLSLLLVATPGLRGAERKAATGAAQPAPASGPARIKVLGVQGRAQFSRNGTTFEPLGPGVELLEGDVIRTASSSALDLAFAGLPSAAVVRITEVTTVVLGKVAAGPGGIELVLQAGELLTRFPSLPAETRFEVKTSIGIARILGGRARLQARGFLVVLDGKTMFAHVPANGQPAVHIVTGPPATYFTPTAGIQPAPHDLEFPSGNNERFNDCGLG